MRAGRSSSCRGTAGRRRGRAVRRGCTPWRRVYAGPVNVRRTPRHGVVGSDRPVALRVTRTRQHDRGTAGDRAARQRPRAIEGRIGAERLGERTDESRTRAAHRRSRSSSRGSRPVRADARGTRRCSTVYQSTISTAMRALGDEADEHRVPDGASTTPKPAVANMAIAQATVEHGDRPTRQRPRWPIDDRRDARRRAPPAANTSPSATALAAEVVRHDVGHEHLPRTPHAEQADRGRGAMRGPEPRPRTRTGALRGRRASRPMTRSVGRDAGRRVRISRIITAENANVPAST